jgi:hypothetical protein
VAAPGKMDGLLPLLIRLLLVGFALLLQNHNNETDYSHCLEDLRWLQFQIQSWIDTVFLQFFILFYRFMLPTGFEVDSKRHISSAPTESKKKKKQTIFVENRRSKKWRKMLGQWDDINSKKKDKLKRRLRKGIPDCVRGEVWCRLTGVSIHFISLIFE